MPAATQPVREQVRCRQITPGDAEAVVRLLHEGFPDRPAAYWRRAWEVLAARRAPDGHPAFGHLLEGASGVVGVILLIFSHAAGGGAAGGGAVRCNVSSWYVRPSHRAHAAMMILAALRLKTVTYLNVSPARHTWPILQAQGYRRYSEGQTACLPWLSRDRGAARVRAFDPARDSARLPEAEAALMADHAALGCTALVAETAEGLVPFVFARRGLGPLRLPAAQLLYCRDTDGFVRLAGALGRRLLLRGAPVVVLDGTAAEPGLVGRFFPDKSPKYFRGADRPRLNDLAYTELALFGA